jgi:DNA-binding NtrC family response regulator
VLARTFWQELTGNTQPFPDDFLERHEAYSWPGNVRELYNAIAHRVALGDLAETESDWRPKSIPAPPPDGMPMLSAPITSVAEDALARQLPFPHARQRVIDAFERRYMELMLAKHDGNVTKAAAASGIARRYFYVVRSRMDR